MSNCNKNLKTVILAGGSSNRLWNPFGKDIPFAPKQFLKIFNDHSLLQNTVLRLSGVVTPENTLVVTNEKFHTQAKKQLQDIVSGSVLLIEKAAKNTAPAIACSVQFLYQHSGDSIVIIMPADHYIENIDGFHSSLQKAVELAENGYIVTLGIRPAYPEPGFGYIKTAEKLKRGFKVSKFVEKPSLAKAQDYVASGEYFWNSGIFIGKLSVFIQEFSLYAPDIWGNIEKCSFADNTIDEDFSNSVPFISLDHAIIEKSSRIALVKLESNWSDLGTWKSIYNLGQKDSKGNVVLGNASLNNVKNCLIYSPGRKIMINGAENMVFVNIGNTTMSCALELH